MNIPTWIEKAFLRSADALFRRYPQPQPAAERLAGCRIVSHRGEHDNRQIIENTIPAFRAAVAGGVWGIEFDVRWTRDRRPVVIHDPDARRLFGRPVRIRQTDYRILKTACPLIPSLEEVVQTFGRRVHLMVELKHEKFEDIGEQRRALKAHFAGLAPVDDFHLMSLSPEVLDVFDVVPVAARLPIAQANVGAISRRAISKPLGGLLGHYLLVTDALVKKHTARGQNVGTGYVDSLNCLFREVNRHINWIFSNRAAALQAAVQEALNPYPLQRHLGAG
ncbi:MAG: glycerophosphodiester phosphodiesterase [Desulfobacterales bacterium]